MSILKGFIVALLARWAPAEPRLDVRKVVVTKVETRHLLQHLEPRADPLLCYTAPASTLAFSSCVGAADAYFTAHGGCSTGIYTNTISAAYCACNYISLAYNCDRGLCPNIDTASLPATLSVASTLRSDYAFCLTATAGGGGGQSTTTSLRTTATTTSISSSTPTTTRIAPSPFTTSTTSSSPPRSTTTFTSSTSSTTSFSFSSSPSTTPLTTVTRSGTSHGMVGRSGLASQVGLLLCVFVAVLLHM